MSNPAIESTRESILQLKKDCAFLITRLLDGNTTTYNTTAKALSTLMKARMDALDVAIQAASDPSQLS